MLFVALGLARLCVATDPDLTRLSRERVVFQTDFGDIHMAFYPEVRFTGYRTAIWSPSGPIPWKFIKFLGPDTSQVAPKTVQHILKIAELGCYNTNHFFRVDRGFVAQTADILGGRTARLSPEQEAQARKNVPLEVVQGVKHNKRGILSMARSDDPNSGGSSFSVLLGPAPHLDMTYTVFG